jgi:hypothetical protein
VQEFLEHRYFYTARLKSTTDGISHIHDFNAAARLTHTSQRGSERAARSCTKNGQQYLAMHQKAATARSPHRQRPLNPLISLAFRVITGTGMLFADIP